MRRVLLVCSLAFFAIGIAGGVQPKSASADAADLLPSQFCAPNGKVTVIINWMGADPGATEFWVDITKTGADFAPKTFLSLGPIAAGSSSYQQNGLDAHTPYWIRLDQQLPSGDWDYGPPLRLVTACGSTPASAGATFDVIGFATHQSNFGPPSDTVAPGDTLNACGANIIYVFFKYGGLADLTDVIGQWTAAGVARPAFAWALKAGDGQPLFALRPPAGGFVPGTYSFTLASGPANSRQQHIDSSFTVAC